LLLLKDKSSLLGPYNGSLLGRSRSCAEELHVAQTQHTFDLVTQASLEKRIYNLSGRTRSEALTLFGVLKPRENVLSIKIPNA